MTVKQTKKERSPSSKQDDSKTFAFLATFLSIIGFVIALVTKKDNKYVMHYAKQSLVLFIAYMIIYVGFLVLGGIFTLVTLGLGAVIVAPLAMLIGLVFFVLWIISWLNALSGEEKELPLVGKYAKKFNF